MILGDVEEVVTTVEIDDETYEEIVRVCCCPLAFPYPFQMIVRPVRILEKRMVHNLCFLHTVGKFRADIIAVQTGVCRQFIKFHKSPIALNILKFWFVVIGKSETIT